MIDEYKRRLDELRTDVLTEIVDAIQQRGGKVRLEGPHAYYSVSADTDASECFWIAYRTGTTAQGHDEPVEELIKILNLIYDAKE